MSYLIHLIHRIVLRLTAISSDRRVWPGGILLLTKRPKIGLPQNTIRFFKRLSVYDGQAQKASRGGRRVAGDREKCQRNSRDRGAFVRRRTHIVRDDNRNGPGSPVLDLTAKRPIFQSAASQPLQNHDHAFIALFLVILSDEYLK
jgi:hypothetical protein